MLGKLQALPTDARPVKSWPDLDEALYNVTEGIRIVIEEITPKSSTPPPVQSTQPVSQIRQYSQKTKEQWLEEGERYGDLEQYSEALAAYEQAIRLDPNNAIAFNNKGWVLNKLKRYEEALAACEQAIRLDPNYAPVYNNKGIALIGLKRYQEALVACEQAIRLDPNIAEAYQNKGNALSGLNRKREAQQAYEKARQLGYGID